MKQPLNEIFILESDQKFDEAFSLYKTLLKSEPLNFEYWKHYFFFLWSMLEHGIGIFSVLKNEELHKELKKELQYGLDNFENIAELNLIAGYTISIFPYEFGDYTELEEVGKTLLKKATEINPQNLIFKMILLGSYEKPTHNEKLEYEDLKPKVAKLILDLYSEKKGLLNEYFVKVFARK
jgi:hypothetical protein